MKMTDLSQDQLGRITALYRARGATADTVGRVAKTWNITESDARALGTAATTKAKAPSATRAVTESHDASGVGAEGVTGLDPRKVHLAEELARSVNAAEARIASDGGSMAGLSTQQLEALTAARFG